MDVMIGVSDGVIVMDEITGVSDDVILMDEITGFRLRCSLDE